VHATDSDGEGSMEASKITTKGDALIQIAAEVTCVHCDHPLRVCALLIRPCQSP
jgi:hypothetical protein